jgi:hypothetical protein
MPVLLDTTFVGLLAFHPEAGQQQRTSGAEVRCDDLDTGVTNPVLAQPLLQMLRFTVAHVVGGAVSAGGAEPNRAVQ